MEPKYNVSQNGQEVQQNDFNSLGDTAALADDRILADLLRLQPYNGSTVVKAVMPFGYPVPAGATAPPVATVAPSGSANGSVVISPFRAVIGTRTAVGTDALKNWRDIRTAVFVGGSGSWNDNVGLASSTPPTTQAQTLGFTANASGNPRWDLVYALVTIDANNTNQTRYVKPPSGNAATQAVSTQQNTTISIAVQAGAPGANPAFPAIPGDSGSTFYIPLAYVKIPNGFTSGSTIATADVCEAIPNAPAALGAAGGSSLMPANQQNAPGGQVLSPTAEGVWGAGAGGTNTRPRTFMPPGMIGMKSIVIAVDLSGGTPANWSHQSGAIVDNTIDWSKRVFRTLAMANTAYGAGTHFAWDKAVGATNTLCPDFALTNSVVTVNTVEKWQMGNSFVNSANNLPGTPPANGGTVCFFTQSHLPVFGAAAPLGVGLYVDYAANNALKIYINGTTLSTILFLWVDATGQFSNY